MGTVNDPATAGVARPGSLPTKAQRTAAARDRTLTSPTAIEMARSVLADLTIPEAVGPYTAARSEGERLVTHLFETTMAGYRGWRWAVTVSRPPRSRTATVCEVGLLPGEEALLAPAWVPWADRLRPGDVGRSDRLPRRETDERLEPGWEATGEEGDAAALDELDLGRARVLSPAGRSRAAQRWYDGEAGPGADGVRQADATCGTCGFLMRMPGSMRGLFGVCANEWAPDDGRVVSLDHGCGAHSETDLPDQGPEWPVTPARVDEADLEVLGTDGRLLREGASQASQDGEGSAPQDAQEAPQDAQEAPQDAREAPQAAREAQEAQEARTTQASDAGDPAPQEAQDGESPAPQEAREARDGSTQQAGSARRGRARASRRARAPRTRASSRAPQDQGVPDAPGEASAPRDAGPDLGAGRPETPTEPDQASGTDQASGPDPAPELEQATEPDGTTGAPQAGALGGQAPDAKALQGGPAPQGAEGSQDVAEGPAATPQAEARRVTTSQAAPQAEARQDPAGQPDGDDGARSRPARPRRSRKASPAVEQLVEVLGQAPGREGAGPDTDPERRAASARDAVADLTADLGPDLTADLHLDLAPEHAATALADLEAALAART